MHIAVRKVNFCRFGGRDFWMFTDLVYCKTLGGWEKEIILAVVPLTPRSSGRALLSPLVFLVGGWLVSVHTLRFPNLACSVL